MEGLTDEPHGDAPHVTSGRLVDLQTCAARHLDEYTDPAGDYAFRTYDRQGAPDVLTPVDCLAPALLSVYIRGNTVRDLFKPTGAGSRLLDAMQAVLNDAECQTADFIDLDLAASSAWRLVDRAVYLSKDVRWFRGVAVTKTLHRKRPSLIPILDRLVYGYYTGKRMPPGPYDATPRAFWPVLQEELRINRGWLGALATKYETPDGRPLSVLRAADIVVWTHAKTH